MKSDVAMKTTQSNTQQFVITDMNCQACANRLEKVLNKNPAVDSAQVNFATETLSISYHDADTQDVVSWIKKAGFTGKPLEEMKDVSQKPAFPYELLLLWLLSAPFWFGMVGMMVGSHALMPPVWLQFVLASVVQFAFGWRFYRGAWASLRGGLANMDVLVALGTTAIWAYSTYIWATYGEHGSHGVVYFEASVMIIAFVSLGKYLEMRTKKDSLNSLSSLMNLVPKTAMRRYGDDWQIVDVDKIKHDDVLLARVGDRIAVDGIMTVGTGVLDEAHLTGESESPPKSVGDSVMAGSIVTHGSFEYRAVAMGDQTALADMITALHEAQGSKANIARLADRITGVFVPVVVSIAFGVLAINWFLLGSFEVALMRAVAVLVIACPCALGLATPAAITAGMGVAARHGVRFKDAPSLEMAGHIDTMIFDKTGTLTMGRPEIRVALVTNKLTYDEALAITASIEQYAMHPLANSIVKSALDKGLALSSLKEPQTFVGRGISGDIDGIGLVKVGTPDFIGMSDFNQFIKNTPSEFTSFYTDDVDQSLGWNLWQICSVVAVSVNDQLIAVYALADVPKPDAKALLDRLRLQHVDVMILSGDRQSVTDSVAKALDVSLAYGEMSPKDKATKINELKDKGRTVAMIGDGVNDAPAMAAAQASFSVHDASSVAKYAASAELMGDSLIGAYHAQKIAKATLRTIKQNLFFAFIYNIFGIGLAAFGLLNPIIAAAAMALSSICVLSNALRLKRLDLKDVHQA